MPTFPNYMFSDPVVKRFQDLVQGALVADNAVTIPKGVAVAFNTLSALLQVTAMQRRAGDDERGRLIFLDECRAKLTELTQALTTAIDESHS